MLRLLNKGFKYIRKKIFRNGFRVHSPQSTVAVVSGELMSVKNKESLIAMSTKFARLNCGLSTVDQVEKKVYLSI